MKNVKQSLIALSFIALGFTSCNKETDVVLPVTAQTAEIGLAIATGTMEGSIRIYDGSGTSIITSAAIGESITLKGDFGGFSCGKVQLQRRLDGIDPATGLPYLNETIQQHDMIDGTYEFNNVTHDANGTYFYSVHYVSSGKDCFNGVQWTEELSFVVKPACSGFNLAVTGGSVDGNNISFDMVASNCTGNDITFKLQGGLIAGASNVVVSNPNGYTFSQKNKNTVLTWNNITLKDGETFSTTVTYSITKGLTEGMNLSGNWSAKDVANIIPAATLPNITLVKNTPTVIVEPTPIVEPVAGE